MIAKFSNNVVALTAIVAAAALTLTGPAKAQIAAGFDAPNSGANIAGFSWNVNTGAVAHAANGSGGSNTAMFGVSANGQVFVGVADDSSGLFHGAAWNGVNAASTTPAGGFFDSGNSQGFAGNDTPWSINNSGNAVGQGVGQVAGYDQGFFAGIEWTGNGSAIVDMNSFNDPAGNAINGSSYYGGPVYLEGYDITGGLLGSAAGINTSGQISATSFQNFGSFYYQGVIVSGSVKVIPYFDANDPAATSWNLSEAGAVTGYNFINSLSQAVGYTATVASSGYSYNASSGGTGTLNNYGSGPNNNFIWGLGTNDSGNGSGALVGFDIDSSGSFNHDVYAKNKSTSQEVADDRGGNTTFLVGVAGDGTSAGFETISADGESNFHAFGTKTGTPGATADYPEGSGVVGSKAFEVSAGAGSSGPVVQSISIKGKPKHGKAIKGSITLTSAATGSGLVVTVSNTLPSGDLANFTVTVPAGSTTANYTSPKLSKSSKKHTGHLVANPGAANSATFTVK